MVDEETYDIASRARLRTYGKRDAFFMQGEPLRELFLVRSGHVKLTQLSAGGKEVLLWVSGPHSVLGIRAEMNNQPYSCSAYAIEACTAWCWDRAALTYLSSKHRRLGQNMTAILMDRVRELEERFRELATESVSRRLALALLRLGGQIGKKVPQGIEIRLSREEMAQMTGTTLFSISRTLSEWARQKLVLAGRQSVVIPDTEALEALGGEAPDDRGVA